MTGNYKNWNNEKILEYLEQNAHREDIYTGTLFDELGYNIEKHSISLIKCDGIYFIVSEIGKRRKYLYHATDFEDALVEYAWLHNDIIGDLLADWYKIKAFTIIEYMNDYVAKNSLKDNQIKPSLFELIPTSPIIKKNIDPCIVMEIYRQFSKFLLPIQSNVGKDEITSRLFSITNVSEPTTFDGIIDEWTSYNEEQVRKFFSIEERRKKKIINILKH